MRLSEKKTLDSTDGDSFFDFYREQVMREVENVIGQQKTKTDVQRKRRAVTE